MNPRRSKTHQGLDGYERVLEVAEERARRYLAGVEDRPVREEAGVKELHARLDRKLPNEGEDPATVVEELAEAAEPGLIALGSPRYFGFVIGGAPPAALGAEWLTTSWDQIASLYVCGPSASVAEEVSGHWVLELLGLPTDSGFGLTTGGTMANFSGIAAGLHAVLERRGWDVEAKGLQGAPEVRVLVGEHAHATIFVALRFLGLGDENAVRVRADDAGRMDPEALAAELDRGEGPAIVCAQAGDVNTGCFDPFPALAEICERHEAWLHVDGAVGLWAAASSEFDDLTKGLERADSWSTDAHKWLNVTYDCGFIAVKDADHLRGLMANESIQAILFDIDGTLISTGGASDRAWKRAFKELHDVDVDVPAVTGKGVPDPEVGRQCFRAVLDREPTDQEAAAVMRRRLDHLSEEVENSPGFVVHDGVVDLLERLIDDGLMLGLTTGNVEEAAHIKLARANLNRFFSFGGYGSDSPDRTELTKKALERADLVLGRELDHSRCFSCGDTPRDVEAGH